MLYPLIMRPYFRHGTDTPWGGSNLGLFFGKDIPDDHTGESLEISALASTPSTVANGPLAGKTLAEIDSEYPVELKGNNDVFPLMAKLIDAKVKLSVQVHPGDEYAGKMLGKKGKTEAWLVVSADRGSYLYAGLQEGCAEVSTLCEDDKMMQDALQKVPVIPGDVLYIPHGLVHALTDGVMVYEIQQSSDVTYRISDWGRMGLDGKPRTLHLDDAKAVIRKDLRPQKKSGASFVVEGGVRTLYVCDANFALWRLNCSGNMPLEQGKMLLLTALTPCEIACEGMENMPLQAGESAVIPAACPPCSIIGKAQVILSTAPEQEKMRSELGARSINVAGLND